MKHFAMPRALGALFYWLLGKPAPAAAEPQKSVPPERPQNGDPRWLQRALVDLGVREMPGPESNPRIMDWWRYVDYQPPRGDETSNCSAGANCWMQEAGLPGTRAPNARSWLKWGHELKTPKRGCIVVFWRGSPSGWEGHVAFYIGPGKAPGTISVLGANQRNAVSIADYPVEKVLGYRWPTTGANSRTLKAQAAGAVGDAVMIVGVVGLAAPELLAIGTDLQSLGFTAGGIILSIAARLVTIFARLSDWQTKGV